MGIRVHGAEVDVHVRQIPGVAIIAELAMLAAVLPHGVFANVRDKAGAVERVRVAGSLLRKGLGGHLVAELDVELLVGVVAGEDLAVRIH